MDSNVSVYRTARTKKSHDVCDIHTVADRIRSDEFRDRIVHLRSLDAESYKREKADTPAFTAGGVFEPHRRSNVTLKEHSGLVVIDLDGLSDADDVVQRANDMPETMLCFVSPSGSGVKIIVKLDPAPLLSTQHSKAWGAVAAFYADALGVEIGVEIDQSGKDVARLCFFSWDPGAYFNPDSEPVAWEDFVAEPLAEPHTSEDVEPEAVDDEADPNEALEFCLALARKYRATTTNGLRWYSSFCPVKDDPHKEVSERQWGFGVENDDGKFVASCYGRHEPSQIYAALRADGFDMPGSRWRPRFSYLTYPDAVSSIGWGDRYNVDMSMREVLPPRQSKWVPRRQDHIDRIIEDLQLEWKGKAQPPGVERIARAMSAARDLISCSPEVERLKKLVADYPEDRPCGCENLSRGKCSLFDLLETVFVVSDECPAELSALASKLLILGPIERTLKPGCPQDTITILIGRGGIGKSNLLRNLVHDPLQFCEIPGSEFVNGDTKLLVERTQTATLVEISEVNFTRRPDFVKSLISQRFDTVRLAFQGGSTEGYGERYPRKEAYTATTNNPDPLPSGEDNRRMLPVKIESARMGKDHTESWVKHHLPFFQAEAMRMIAEGQTSQPDGETTQLIIAHSRKYEPTNEQFARSIERIVARHVSENPRIGEGGEIRGSSLELWVYAGMNPDNHHSKRMSWRSALLTAGWSELPKRWFDDVDGTHRKAKSFTFTP